MQRVYRCSQALVADRSPMGRIGKVMRSTLRRWMSRSRHYSATREADPSLALTAVATTAEDAWRRRVDTGSMEDRVCARSARYAAAFREADGLRATGAV